MDKTTLELKIQKEVQKEVEKEIEETFKIINNNKYLKNLAITIWNTKVPLIWNWSIFGLWKLKDDKLKFTNIEKIIEGIKEEKEKEKLDNILYKIDELKFIFDNQ